MGHTYDVELWLGKGAIDRDTLVSPERVHTAKNMPVPRIGDVVYGRSDEGQQFVGVVLWVHHFYETRSVRVYMRNA